MVTNFWPKKLGNKRVCHRAK